MCTVRAPSPAPMPTGSNCQLKTADNAGGLSIDTLGRDGIKIAPVSGVMAGAVGSGLLSNLPLSRPVGPSHYESWFLPLE